MILSRSDAWASVGIAMSSALSVYAWLYSIGLVPLFTFITGSFFTLWTQERFENKRRKQEFDRKMTEYVYGPLHQDLDAFLKDLDDFQSSLSPTNRVSTLANFMKDYRYGFAKEEIRHNVEKLQKRLPLYAKLFNETQSITRSYIKQYLNKYRIEDFIIFKLLDSQKQELYRTNMLEPIFRGKTPLQLLTEQATSYRKTSTVVIIGSRPDTGEELFSNEHKLEQISKDVLEKMEKDPAVQEQRAERELLIKECTFLLEMIRKEIILS